MEQWHLVQRINPPGKSAKYIIRRYVTKPTRSTQPCIPLELLNRVPALIGWGKGRNITSARWQVTPCDPIWHASSRSGEACSWTAISGYFTYLFYLPWLHHLHLYKKAVLSQRWPRDAPTKVNKQTATPTLKITWLSSRLTQFNRTLWTQVLNEHFLPQISPCFPGNRWMIFGLWRAKMLG